MTIATWLLSIVLVGCATRTNSIFLGTASGLLLGGYTGIMTENYNDTGARIRNTSTGVAVGVGIGALAGYLLHKQLEEKLNKCTVPQEHDPKIHFGELPPNPFDADLDTRE